MNARQVPLAFRAQAKAAVRRVVRARGYDIVPLAAGLPAFQRRLLRRVGAVVDVGANVGQFAERVRDLGFTGPMYSFEPGSQAFTVLAARAEAQPDWAVYRCAVGSAPGEAVLHLAGNSVSSSLLKVEKLHVAADSDSAPVGSETVPVARLDDELPELADCYLKLDVQGYELEALRGGERVLESALAVQCEVSFDALYEDQTEWTALCGHLAERGLHVGYLEPGYEDGRTGQMLQADFVFVRGDV